jgi:glycosyltransferase involved in cell wall biosynthesis
MACGTPVLATSAGAAPALVDDEVGRLLPTEQAAFVDAIREFSLMSNTHWRQMSKASRVRAEAHDLDKALERFERALVYAIDKERCP